MPTLGPRIIWRATVPSSIREIVEPWLSRSAIVIPTHYHDLIVGWDSTEAEFDAEMRSEPEYRWCFLLLRPGMAILRDEEACAETTLHECIHTLVHPMHSANVRACRQFQSVIPDKVANELLNEFNRIAMEEVVCDLTRLFMPIIFPEFGSWQPRTPV